MVLVPIRLTTDQRDKLQRLADQEDRAVAYLVRRIVGDFLKGSDD